MYEIAARPTARVPLVARNDAERFFDPQMRVLHGIIFKAVSAINMRQTIHFAVYKIK